MAGTYSGPINISTDSGVSWGAVSPPIPSTEPGSFWNGSFWKGLVCPANGNEFVAVPFEGPICTSTNSNGPWTESSFIDMFSQVVSSADGTQLATVAAHSDSLSGIYLSKDGGKTWTQANTTNLNWLCVACSADGRVIAAGPGNGAAYISRNWGATWTPTLPDGYWISIACSADGAKLMASAWAAAASVSGVWTSTDSGSTWTQTSLSPETWYCLAMSTEGDELIAAAHGGPIFVSTDLGKTWAQTDAPNTNWYAIACSADGHKVIAASMNIGDDYLGLVYTRQITPTPTLNVTRTGNDLLLSWTAPSTPLVLQETSNLITGAWAAVSATPTLNYNSLRYQVRLSTPSGNRFYRLMSR